MRLRTAAAIVLASALLLPGAAFADPPTCSPDVAGTPAVQRDSEFLVGHSDNTFGVGVKVPLDPTGQFPIASVDNASMAVTADPPAVVTPSPNDTFALTAPVGAATLHASWNEQAEHGPVCRASGTMVVLLVAGLVPPVRFQPIDAPAAIGPTLSWPCAETPRVTDGASTIVAHYERGLTKTPGNASPALHLALKSPCERNLHRQVKGSLGLSLGVGDEYVFDPTRYAVALYPTKPGDLRVAIDISWAGHRVFHGEYAMVYAGRRSDDNAQVFLTTTPGRAAAAARRYARQRRGAPYVSPGARTSARSYAVKVSGGYTVAWSAARGAPGDPGCGFVTETGTDKVTFTTKTADGQLRGSLVRTYTPINECPPVPALGELSSSICPLHLPLVTGIAKAELIPSGGLLSTGKVAHGPRLSLSVSLEFDGFCPGWEVGPSIFFDVSGRAVDRLKLGRSTTVPLRQRFPCADQISGQQGNVTACTLRTNVTARVRRVR